MKYKVKDVQFVKGGDDIVIDIIQKSSKEVGKSITRGLVNKDKITTDTEFDYAFTYDAGLEYQYVYVALKNEYGDLIKKGILDPTKVTRSALINAASVSATLLTTEALVVEIEDKPKPKEEEVY